MANTIEDEKNLPTDDLEGSTDTSPSLRPTPALRTGKDIFELLRQSNFTPKPGH